MGLDKSKMLNKEGLLNQIALALLFFLLLLYMVKATLTVPRPVGESDDYMFASVSFMRHLDFEITKEDYTEALKLFSEIQLKNVFADSYKNKLLINREGKRFPIYFGIYSILCIPMIILLEFLKLSASYAFAVTNLIFFIVSMVVVYKFLPGSKLTILLSIAILGFSPAFYYTTWPSCEVVMFSFVVMSLVFWFRNNYRLAALFISLAGTMNPTIMIFGIVILLNYFIDLFKQEKVSGKTNIFRMIYHNTKDIFILALCFSVVLIPFILSYKYFGIFNLSAELKSSEYLLGRLKAYFVDLNFGFLPYFPLLLIAYTAVFIAGIFRKNIKVILSFLGFIGTVLMYSYMSHINCGMLTIARYNFWTFPIFALTALIAGKQVYHKVSAKRILSISFAVSVIYTSAVLINIMEEKKAYNWSYISFTPIAAAVLDNAPSLYNPLPSTFISRTVGVDGGYTYCGPVIYTNTSGFIRKILLTPSTSGSLFKIISGEDKIVTEIKKAVEKADQAHTETEFYYINIEESWKNNIKLTSPVIYTDSKGLIRQILLSPSDLDPFFEMITGDEDVITEMKNMSKVIEHARVSNGFYYLSIKRDWLGRFTMVPELHLSENSPNSYLILKHKCISEIDTYTWERWRLKRFF